MTDLKKVTIRKRLVGKLIDYILFATIGRILWGFGHWPRLGELDMSIPV